MNMLDKFRSSIFYKLSGIICAIISAFSLLLYNLPHSNSLKGEGALLVLPVLLLFVAASIIDVLVYIILTLIAFISALSNESSDNKSKTNIIADIGYIFTTGFIIYLILNFV